MRPGNQIQSIQCCGSRFPLDIFGFPSFLYVYGARPYHQSFLEGHFDHQDLYLICVWLIRGDIPPQIFLGSYFSCTFMVHVHITRTSWKVILIIRIYIRSAFSLSEKIFLLELELLTLSAKTPCSQLKPKTQLYDLGP